MAVDAPTQVGPAVVARVLETIAQVVAEVCPGRADITRDDGHGVTRLTVTPRNPDAAPLGFLLAEGEPWVHMGFGEVFTELPLRREEGAPTLAEEVTRIARAVILGRYHEDRWLAGGRVEEIVGIVSDDGVEEAYGRSGPASLMHRLWADRETRTYAPY
jgi:hypothetical protein